MSNKKNVFNNLLSRAQAIYNDWIGAMGYVPTEMLKRQIKKASPELEDAEIDRLVEEEVQRYFSRKYMQMNRPSCYDTNRPILRIPSSSNLPSPTPLSSKQPLPIVSVTRF